MPRLVSLFDVQVKKYRILFILYGLIIILQLYYIFENINQNH